MFECISLHARNNGPSSGDSVQDKQTHVNLVAPAPGSSKCERLNIVRTCYMLEFCILFAEMPGILTQYRQAPAYYTTICRSIGCDTQRYFVIELTGEGDVLF